MKRLGLRCRQSLAAGAVLAWSQQAPPPADPELQAMRDELERSRKMSLPNLEPPYFVQYLIDESAELQRLRQSRRPAFAAARPVPRSRKSAFAWAITSSTTRNYAGSGFNFGVALRPGALSAGQLATTCCAAISGWQTDSAYKSAVEAISRKRAALRNLHAEREAQRLRARRAGEAPAAAHPS